MKKTTYIILAIILSFSIISSVSAKTTQTAKTKTIKKISPIVIDSSKKGIVSQLDYDKGTFILNIKKETYLVKAASSSVYVPGVKKVVNINNLADEMEVSVSGTVDGKNKTIKARTIKVIPTRTKK